MKKIILILTVAVTASCMSLENVPLKGNYVDQPIVVSSSKSYDELWSSVIDLFAQEGLAINVLDKESGLITSSKTDLLPFHTFEDRNGNLLDPSALVVIETIKFKVTKTPMSPTSLTGTWNVRIKKDGNASTINVNLVNIDAFIFNPQGGNRILQAKSTGVFEKLITDKIK